jgi:hypothetical protein
MTDAGEGNIRKQLDYIIECIDKECKHLSSKKALNEIEIRQIHTRLLHIQAQLSGARDNLAKVRSFIDSAV